MVRPVACVFPLALIAASMAAEQKPAAEHLVAAWDFEEANGGPLADKASAGVSKDSLKPLGDAKVEQGVGLVPATAGSAFLANSSQDLELPGELTIWARLRVERDPTGFISLVDKRRLRNPEERSYALYIPPSTGAPAAYALGGQISLNGLGDASVTYIKAEEKIPVGQWREVAMVVERAADGSLAVRWYSSANAEPKGAADFALVAGPVSNPVVRSIFRSRQPVLLGNDSNLRPNSSRVELDEVRLYDRALAPQELAALTPGELSKE